MPRSALPPLLLLLLLVAASPVSAQHRLAGTPLQRGVAAIRLRAMLGGRAAMRTPGTPILSDPHAALPLRLPERAGRLVSIPLAPALDLRAGIQWWPTGPRALAGLRYRY